MMNKEKNFVSAVVYVHNAGKRIERFLGTILSVLEKNFEHSEVICVNDCSTDDSADVIKRVSRGASTASISIVNLSYFHGVEVAMNAGMDLAIGDFVFEFDKTILDFDKDIIMKIYRRSLEGYDIVSASPDKKQKLSSRMFYYVFDKFADFKYKMTTESFRILSRRVINRISSMNKTVPYRKVVYASCGLQSDNIRYPVVNTGEDTTADTLEKRERSSLAVDSLVLFTNFGYSFAKTMTVVMILAALFMAVYSLVVYLIGSPIEGWTTTVMFLSFSFFGLFGILTIVIKYLQIIVNLVFQRKRYTFKSIEKLTK